MCSVTLLLLDPVHESSLVRCCAATTVAHSTEITAHFSVLLPYRSVLSRAAFRYFLRRRYSAESIMMKQVVRERQHFRSNARSVAMSSPSAWVLPLCSEKRHRQGLSSEDKHIRTVMQSGREESRHACDTLDFAGYPRLRSVTTRGTSENT